MSFVAIFDTYLAGTISREATSAVGLASYVGWFASLILALVGTGTTAIVARSIGRKEYGVANSITNQSISLGILLGIMTSCGLYLVAPIMANLQQMQGETMRIVVHYLRIDAWGHILASISVIGSAALRGSGNMRTPMLIFSIVNVLNVFFSLAFVSGAGPLPELGVDGIAVGTLVARSIGGILTLAVLWLGAGPLRLALNQMRLETPIARRILYIGIPAALDGIVMWTGHFVFLMVIAQLPSPAGDQVIYAAHIIAARVEVFTFLPAIAWGTAAATLVGQLLGQGETRRSILAGYHAAWQCAAISAVGGLVYFVFAEDIYRLMHSDAAVWKVGVPAFRWLALFQPAQALGIVFVMALRGAGDTRFPMVLTLIGILLIRIPLGYLFGIVLGGGLIGAWIGMWGDLSIRAIASWVRFARGRWQRIQV